MNWQEHNGMIYFTLTDEAGAVVNIAVLKAEFFSDDIRDSHQIELEARHRGLKRPEKKLVTLIREKIAGKDIREMGLERIIIMHEPSLDDFDREHSTQIRFGLNCKSDQEFYEAFYYHWYLRWWRRTDGFAFAVE